MSFHVSFSARSHHSAYERLREADAPACVKAIIEKAIDVLPWQSTVPSNAPATMNTAPGDQAASGSLGRPRLRAPQFAGVFVETWGHIAAGGPADTSRIEKFEVRPLFD